MNLRPRPLRHALARWMALVALALAFASAAWAQADPPGRVAILGHAEGSVVFAPRGETDWSEAVRNRPAVEGDRFWTDAGGRAELQLGTATLRMDGRTFIEILGLDDSALRASVNEGSLEARVRQLQPGEVFELQTPHLTLRITMPGDYRLDVEPSRDFTRVTVRSGLAVLYGAGGAAMQVQAGQQLVFAGQDLSLVTGIPAPLQDAFDAWVAERNRLEDQSVAARYVPRDVVGYPLLDAYGSWAQDADYGSVWYPNVPAADWAPYRYGHWEWIAPWGWTWMDDAPWGFAPFHYGRWTQIGSRWAWVPGPLGPRPVYAPALVTFVGAGPGAAGGTIGWYPLAPGELWQPFFNASPIYVRNVNRYVRDRRWPDRPRDFLRRPEAITSLRVDDFHRGAPVREHWRRVERTEVPRLQGIAPPPPGPEARRWYADRNRPPGLRVHPPGQRGEAAPRSPAPPTVQGIAPPMIQGGARPGPGSMPSRPLTPPTIQGPAAPVQGPTPRPLPVTPPTIQGVTPPIQSPGRQEVAPQGPARRDFQQRGPRDDDRTRERPEMRREPRSQDPGREPDRMLRERQERAAREHQERGVRDQQERVVRDHQERVVRDHQERALRAQQERTLRAQQERAQHDQQLWQQRQEAMQQQRAAREQQRQQEVQQMQSRRAQEAAQREQERAARMQAPQVAPAAPSQLPGRAAPPGEARGRGTDGERSAGDDAGGRGRGHWQR